MTNLTRRAFLAGGCAGVLTQLIGTAHAAPDIVASEKVTIGDAKSAPITITKRVYGKGPLFVSLHANETTAVAVANEFVEKRGGTLVTLSQGKTRNITFQLDGVTYTADPNRIFTPVGARKTLEGLSKHSPEAERILRRFGAHVLEHIGCAPQSLVVALHNNTEGAPLSIQSYAKSKPFRQGVAAVAVVKENDPDDFFLVTEEQHYAAFKNKGFNVAWQDVRSVEDDGSLSVYCAKQKIPYINVEAQHGNKAAQKAMIEAVFALVA
jgi:hypothetical protein